jgi:methyl-accepting chemotaxis protein
MAENFRDVLHAAFDRIEQLRSVSPGDDADRASEWIDEVRNDVVAPLRSLMEDLELFVASVSDDADEIETSATELADARDAVDTAHEARDEVDDDSDEVDDLDTAIDDAESDVESAEGDLTDAVSALGTSLDNLRDQL